MNDFVELMTNLEPVITDKLKSDDGVVSPPVEGCPKGGVNSPPVEGCPKGGVVKCPQSRNTQNYMTLPYNPNLKARARELRKSGNLSEVLLWRQIKNKQFCGLDFDRQKIIGNYIVDFYCSNCGFVIEIDGSTHNNKVEYDKERDECLSSLGLTVIHILDSDVKQNLSGVMDMLKNYPMINE